MNRRGYRDGFTLAGWLLADLFLIVAMLFTAANGFSVGAQPSPAPTPTPSPPPSPRPTATPTAPATVVPDAIRLQSFCRTARVDAAGLLSKRDAARREAARVLEDTFGDLSGGVSLLFTFARSPSDERAESIAHEVNGLLTSDLISQRTRDLFRGAQTRDYIYKDSVQANEGIVHFELFLSSRLELPRGASSVDCPR